MSDYHAALCGCRVHIPTGSIDPCQLHAWPHQFARRAELIDQVRRSYRPGPAGSKSISTAPPFRVNT